LIEKAYEIEFVMPGLCPGHPRLMAAIAGQDGRA
jgi:hypothetical protein